MNLIGGNQNNKLTSIFFDLRSLVTSGNQNPSLPADFTDLVIASQVKFKLGSFDQNGLKGSGEVTVNDISLGSVGKIGLKGDLEYSKETGIGTVGADITFGFSKDLGSGDKTKDSFFQFFLLR
ncbi:hypothetical protein DSM3645_19908 [Blastopirellula marina DSM 3645]|uniref:Uncharacterized protein n=1 Tax=Blastopirellula marina DSM 3645 TaxID=314230 RepID=A3ZTN0_9BACT|nr:hypothetical protein DSM3645_19908 [Blastopirellula marina DSM 3645]